METDPEHTMPAEPHPGPEETLFAAALLRESPAERAAYLDEACAGNPALRRRVEGLLRASDEAATFLERPVSGPADAVAQPRSPEPDPFGPLAEHAGSRIGRYKLLQQIGEGGCGTVFMAEQEEPVRRRVALKVIKLGMDTRSVVARFEAERQALALMDHPNIAKVLDAGATDSGRPYFVMELVRGIPITRYCDENKLDTRQRLDLFVKVCHAIQHAHQKGIIHRDIKPSNILVTLHDGVPVPKVIDFGIAKATEGRLTDATLFTAFEQFIGTPAYMSPEQAEMSGLDIDTRSDIYALGVLLYELLTGQTPFDARELARSGIDAMRRTIREREPQRPSTRLSTMLGEALTATATAHGSDAVRLLRLIRGDLDWIVMKCLEKDRTRRYETANGLAADIHRHLNNEPVVARPPSTAYRLQKAWRRNRLAYAAGALVVVALTVGLSMATAGLKRAVSARAGEIEQRRLAEQKALEAEAERQRAIDSERQAAANADLARRNLYVADMNLAQRSLDENNLGRAVRLLDRHRPGPGEEDLRGWEWRYLWQLTRGNPHVTLTNRPVVGFSVSLSPDGRLLAAGWEDGQVELWEMPSRQRLWARTNSVVFTYAPAQVAFSPVGNLLAATLDQETVTLHDLGRNAGGESELWRAPIHGKGVVSRIAFSPSGTKLAIYFSSVSYDYHDEAWVIDVPTSRVDLRHSMKKPGPRTVGHIGGIQVSDDDRHLYLMVTEAPRGRYAIQCIDRVTGQEVWQGEWVKDTQGMSTLALSPDGLWLASGSGFTDPTIRIWDTSTGGLVRSLDGHTAWVSRLKFSSDGKHLISAATDQTIRFWDTTTWTEDRVIRGHRDEVHAIAISNDARVLASASKDGDLKIWSLGEDSARRGNVRFPLALGEADAMPLAESRVLLLPAGRPPELLDLKAGTDPVPLPSLGTSTRWAETFGDTLVGFEPDDGRIVFVALRGERIAPLGQFRPSPGAQFTGGGYCPGRHLWAASESIATNSVFLVDVKTPGRRVELTSDVPGLERFTFSRDGRYLLGQTRDRQTARVWDIDRGRMVLPMDGSLGHAAFANGGRVIVTRANKPFGHEIAFYRLDLPDAEPKRLAGRFPCLWLDVSPDGTLVATATRGGAVDLYDAVTAHRITTLHGHMNSAGKVVFSPDGHRLASLGSDGRVKLWDIGTRQELLTLKGASGVRWTADGDVILSGRYSAWIAPTLEEIAAAEAAERTEPWQP